MTCHSCRREIEPGEIVWYEVTGWVRDRKGGGHNAIHNERRTGTVMCESCRLRQKHGGSINQGGLFGDGQS